MNESLWNNLNKKDKEKVNKLYSSYINKKKKLMDDYRKNFKITSVKISLSDFIKNQYEKYVK